MCFAGFTGEHCDVEATKECRTDADCRAGHTCDVATGMCFCEGEGCDTCGCGEFGSDGTCGETHTCDMDATCNGNGRCGFSEYMHAQIYKASTQQAQSIQLIRTHMLRVCLPRATLMM